jgi:MinD superfamily P-loop ATPase
MAGKASAINDKICIRCMCCHEVCRFNAICIGRPFSGRVIWGIVRVFRTVSGR